MGRLHGRRRAVCADLTVFAVFHGPTATSRCHQERVRCGENPTKKYTGYKSVQGSCWPRQPSPPVPVKEMSSATTAAIGALCTHGLILREPKLSYHKHFRGSFLPPPVTKPSRRGILCKANYDKTRPKKKKKITKQFSCPKIKFKTRIRLSLLRVYFRRGGCFFLPTHTPRALSAGQEVGQGKV